MVRRIPRLCYEFLFQPTTRKAVTFKLIQLQGASQDQLATASAYSLPLDFDLFPIRRLHSS